MKKLYSHLICLAVAASAVAQGKMMVNMKDGSSVSIDVDNIEEISFISDAKTFNVNGVSFKMIKVDAGTFTMGLVDGDPYGEITTSEPQHQVTLTKDFYLAETECTQELWSAVMGENNSRFIGDQMPMDKLEWDDAKAFINKLNELTGEAFRLPTEAEWEYAAKGGNKSHGYIYAGSDSINDVAWYAGNAVFEYNKPGYGTHPVGMKLPNELGLYDMTGNVWEWCEDEFTFYTEEAQTDPLWQEGGRNPHVFKGGAWDFLYDYCRSSCHRLPGNRYYDVGFRLCMTIEK